MKNQILAVLPTDVRTPSRLNTVQRLNELRTVRLLYSATSHLGNEIRLLQLYPPSASKLLARSSYRVEGELQIYSLGYKPELDYTAVSHVWGVPKSDMPIVLNKILWVPKILHRLLRQLKTIGAGAWFLIDALCINQGDDDEKSNQVRRLRETFLASANVLVWLGTCELDDDNS